MLINIAARRSIDANYRLPHLRIKSLFGQLRPPLMDAMPENKKFFFLMVS
jgi:hypothetical protein